MYTIGLDIGSMYVKGVLTEINEEGQIKVISAASGKHKGVKSGTIINLEEVRNCILKVLNSINSKNYLIEKYLVNVSGRSVNGYYGKATIPLWKKDGDDKRIKVTKKHYTEVIESAKVSYLGEKSKIIHTFPQSFQIDDQPPTMTPLFMSGYKMKGIVYIIQAEKNHLENINTILNDCQISNYQLIFSPIATAEAILEQEDKESGVVFVNVGAQTSELTIYKAGVLVKSTVIPLGSDFVTKDLSYVLRIDNSTAEDIKLSSGNAFLEDIADDEILDIRSSAIMEDSEVRTKHISEIISARMKEIYEYIVKEIYEDDYQKNTSSFIITGGGMKLKGAEKLFEQYTNQKLSKAIVNGIDISSDYDQIFYATPLGLVKYAVTQNMLEFSKEVVEDEEELSGWQKFKRFLKDLI